MTISLYSFFNGQVIMKKKTYMYLWMSLIRFIQVLSMYMKSALLFFQSLIIAALITNDNCIHYMCLLARMFWSCTIWCTFLKRTNKTVAVIKTRCNKWMKLTIYLLKLLEVGGSCIHASVSYRHARCCAATATAYIWLPWRNAWENLELAILVLVNVWI